MRHSKDCMVVRHISVLGRMRLLLQQLAAKVLQALLLLLPIYITGKFSMQIFEGIFLSETRLCQILKHKKLDKAKIHKRMKFHEFLYLFFSIHPKNNRQAAAAAALQKPLPYRLYPGMPTLGTLGGIPAPAAPFSHLSASSSLSSLSNYYQNSANNNSSLNGSAANGNSTTNGGSSDHSPRRTPSPPLNPGSPPTRRAQSMPPSDDEDSTINV